MRPHANLRSIGSTSTFYVGVTVLVGGIAGVLAAISPMLTAFWAIAIVGGLVFSYRAEWLVPITLVLACIALPAGIPLAINVAGFTFPAYEAALSIAFIVALHKGLNLYARWRIGLLATWILSGSVVALIMGTAAFQIFSDIRNPLQMIMAFSVAAVFINTPIALRCAEVLKWTLWISATLTLGASIAGFALAGRSEVAALGGGNSDATRFLTAATFPALATLCVCIALALLGANSVRSTLSWSFPAIVILIMAFSRNHILGIAVTVGAALVALRGSEQMVKAGKQVILAALALVAVVTIATSSYLSDLPGMTWIGSQIDGYSSRVVDGVSSEALRNDPSARYREKENDLIAEAIDQSPIIGHGFGYSYQPPTGDRGSWSYVKAPYYAHNFYLWILLKTGVVGLILFVLSMVVPVARAIVKPSDTLSTALAATASGLLVISFVAPMPLGAPTAAVLGALIGAICGRRGMAKMRTRNRVTEPSAANNRDVLPVTNIPSSPPDEEDSISNLDRRNSAAR